MAYDVRSVANFVLDIATELHIQISNMAINKVVYFIYEDYLLHWGDRLTDAKIEAWEHGPVFRELYSSFKKYDDTVICELATKVDPETGESVICRSQFSLREQDFMKEQAQKYLRLSASKLRNLSHLPDSPWDHVWNHEGELNVGMHISDDIIRQCASRSWRQ
jgi:uncharacterized phage-associated protein